MAYDEGLAERIRTSLRHLKNVEEKRMMGGLVFMYNGKMCLGIVKSDLMCRIDPDLHEQSIARKGCRTMDMTSRPMKGYILIDDSGMATQKDFDYWIGLALDFNARAKASRKTGQTRK